MLALRKDLLIMMAAARVMRIRPYIGTLAGIVVGGLAILLWLLTFQPHGGVELSPYLFPLSRPILDHLYPTESIPVVLFYSSALLQWVLFGALIDLLRKPFRNANK